MQTTLLGIALALIAAIAAAFAAPFFIDWNEWRPELEAQASALAGTRVTISGNIDATLLPTPAFVLRNVSLGDPDKGTGMRASEMRGSLSLTALLSGRFEAEEFVLSRPAIRVAIDRDGKFVLPEGASAGQEVSVSGFVIEAGSLTIDDRRTGSLFMADDFSARGELSSREGPFRLDGNLRVSGARWILRASSGRFGGHMGRVRLSLEQPSENLVVDAEGNVSLSDHAPKFDGKIVATRKAGPLPWRAASDAAGDLSEVRFSNLEVGFGEGETPILLSGTGKFSPRAGGILEALLSSKRIDLDLGDPQAATKGAAFVFPMLAKARDLLAQLPVAANVSLAADGIFAGGQLVRDLQAELRAKDGLVALERLNARLPGRGLVNLSGNTHPDRVEGAVMLESAEPQLLLRWLLGQELAAKISAPESLRFSGNVTHSQKGIAFENVDAAIGAVGAKGSAELSAQPDGRQLLRLKLALERVNFDDLLALDALKNAPVDVRAELSAQNARLFGINARRIEAVANTHGGEFTFGNLVLEDFEGLSLNVKRGGDQMQSALEFSGEATRPAGLSALLDRLAGSDVSSLVLPYLAPNYPLRFSGAAAPEKGGWRGQIKSEEFSLDGLIGALTNERRAVDVALRRPQTEILAKGDVRLPKDGRAEPLFSLSLKSSDLRAAFQMAAWAAAAPLPAHGTAKLARSGDRLVLDNLSFELSGTKGTGQISFPAGKIEPLAGQLVLDRADARHLISFALGRSDNAVGEFSVPVLAYSGGSLKIEIGVLQLTERIAVNKARFNLRIVRPEYVLDDFSGEIAGGKVTGVFRFADTFPRVAEIRAEIADANIAMLTAAKSLRGRASLSLMLGASGYAPEPMIASLSGQGKVTLTNIELDATDATAVASVYAASSKTAPDEATIEQTLLAALAKGSLKVSKLEAPLVVANGIFRSGSAKAVAGKTEIVLSGAFNAPKQNVEAQLSIETAGETSVRPGVTIRWEGPLDAPERKVDARALITAVTLRAIERGQRNPSNINLPQEEAPPAKKKRAPTEAAPPLPPPTNVLRAPQPLNQNQN